MKRFKSAGQTQCFLAAHGQINNLFHLRRDHVTADQYRAARTQAISDLGRGHRRGHFGIIVGAHPAQAAHIVSTTAVQVDGAACCTDDAHSDQSANLYRKVRYDKSEFK